MPAMFWLLLVFGFVMGGFTNVLYVNTVRFRVGFKNINFDYGSMSVIGALVLFALPILMLVAALKVDPWSQGFENYARLVGLPVQTVVFALVCLVSASLGCFFTNLFMKNEIQEAQKILITRRLKIV